MDSTWHTIAILLAGIVTVVGAVLVLRLHAFLALVLAGLLVGSLTRAEAIERFALTRDGLRVASVDAAAGTVTLNGRGLVGTQYDILQLDGQDGPPRTVAAIELTSADGGTLPRSVGRLLDSAAARAVQPGNVAVHAVARQAAARLAGQTVGERLAEGFGRTCASIGILIAMASIVGKCLLDSGAADRIVRSALKLFGVSGAPAAFLLSGFLLGVPVFFDTVFYLMIPLGKAMRVRTGRGYLLYVLTIVAGATMAHSLVPPTPGPLFAAEQLGVSLGTMMIGGTIVGLVTSASGYLYALAVSRYREVPLRDSPDVSLAELEALARKDERELPPLGLALLPIVLPVILIGGYALLEPSMGGWPAWAAELAETAGDKDLAMTLSAAIALAMLVWRRRTSRAELARAVESALAGAGTVILITAGGGAFGATLQQTGVAGLIQRLPVGGPAAIVTMAFLVTTAIRTAQGSATVAMITAAGILSGLAASGDLPFHPVYLALAVGCGSKPFTWMNDSGFWVITKMTGMTEAETLRYVTPMTALMGFVGLAATVLGVTFLPLR
jgi:GntP family gluconate:H+ symporter